MKKVFWLIMVSLLVFVFLACSEGVEGTYDRVSGNNYARSVVLRKDKTGTLVYPFGSYSGNYRIEGKKFILTIEGFPDTYFTINGDTLTTDGWDASTYKKAKTTTPHAAANSTTPAPVALSLDEYYHRAGESYSKGDYDSAIADYTEAIQLTSNNNDKAVFYNNRSSVYIDKGDYDRALSDLSESIRLRSDDAFSYGLRAFVYMQKGNITQARTDTDRALQIDPNFDLAIYLDEELKQRGSQPSVSAATQPTAPASQSSSRVSYPMASESDFGVSLASDGTAIITTYNGKGGNIAVPSMIQGVQVTQLAQESFSKLSSMFGNIELTGIQLPEGLKVIGEGAFAYCTYLKTVTIPGTVTEIRKNAFDWCLSLESISIPDSVTVFGEGIFSTSVIKSFTFPAGIIASKKIPANMFNNSGLSGRVVIPEGIETIGQSAFETCESLTSVTLPSTIKVIENYAFNECEKLTEIIIPEGVTSIRFGGNSFTECRNLTLVTQARLKELGWNGQIY